MGLIQIRNRSERLGNIGGVRGVSNDIGADRAILAMSRADRQIDAARGDIADAAIGGAKDLLKLDYGQHAALYHIVQHVT